MASSTRSPSPNPARSQNLHFGSPEPFNAGLRRAPVANQNSSAATRKSTTDLPHRVSGCKGSPALRSSFEQKENERDMSGSAKNNKMKLPSSTPSSKGAKNFMAPTISASSKAISASPRRRILSDKNDVVRSSLTSLSSSFESVGSVEMDSKSETGYCPFSLSETPDALTRPSVEENGSKFEVGSRPIAVSGGFIGRNLDSELMKSNRFATDGISPLDADPALPPYDPKTNYLSPRPQFLHYRPKPRIELHLDKDENLFDSDYGKQLEESFSSESSRESTETFEATERYSVPDEESLSTEADAGEGTTTNEVLDVEIEKNETSHLEVEPEKIVNPVVLVVVTPRRRFFARPKLISLLLLFAIACFSISPIDTPTIASFPKLSDRDFDKLYAPFSLFLEKPQAGGHLSRVAKLVPEFNFNELVKFFQNVAHFPALTSISRERVDLLQFPNSTVFLSETSMGIVRNYQERIQEGVVEVNAKEDELNLDERADVKEEHCDLEKDSVVVEAGEETDTGGDEEENEDEDLHQLMDIEDVAEEEVQTEDTEAPSIETDIADFEPLALSYPGTIGVPSSLAGAESADDAVAVTHESEDPDEIVDDSAIGFSENGITSDEHDEETGSSPDASEPTDHIPLPDDEESSMQTVLASSIALALATALLTCYLRRRRASSPTQTPPPSKKGSGRPKDDDAPPRRDCYPTEMETTMHESGGPSEMSSTYNRGLSSRRGGEGEMLSVERRLRRDSTASSSSAASYGSFTTFEKLHGVKGFKEEAALTPVRRSNRIRNQVASPSCGREIMFQADVGNQ